MNEQDGHMMLVARCKALEDIALKYMGMYELEVSTAFSTDQELKGYLEQEVEKRAPGCGHITRSKP